MCIHTVSLYCFLSLTHSHASTHTHQRQSCLSVKRAGFLTCVCRSNTGAVRDTEEETCLPAFELDLEKKAVSPSCQISLTVMPPSFSAQIGLEKPHSLTGSKHSHLRVWPFHCVLLSNGSTQPQFATDFLVHVHSLTLL